MTKIAVRHEREHAVVPNDKVKKPVEEDDRACILVPRRLTSLIAPSAKSIQAYDSSDAMLKRAARKMTPLHGAKLSFHVAKHQDCAFEEKSADIVMSGWSLCYLVTDDPLNWKRTLRDLMTAFFVVLRENGQIIIIETMGTGCAIPIPPDHLTEYFAVLESFYGFKKETIRTDCKFTDNDEAERFVELFFGPETTAKIDHKTLRLPENTVIFSRKIRTTFERS